MSETKTDQPTASKPKAGKAATSGASKAKPKTKTKPDANSQHAKSQRIQGQARRKTSKSQQAPTSQHTTVSQQAVSQQGSPQTATPGEEPDYKTGLQKYLIGLLLAALLTAFSFWAATSQWLWQPAVPVLLAALAIGQMGVHLLFFLHISSGPESTNNILALSFGVFVVALVVFGSIIIMHNLDSNMLPMGRLLEMQR